MRFTRVFLCHRDCLLQVRVLFCLRAFFGFLAAQVNDLGRQHFLAYMEPLRTVFDIHLPRDQVRDDGDRGSDILDERRAFLRIVARIFAQQRRLETDEIRLVFLDITDELRRVVVLCVTVRVLAVRQQHHLHVEALFQEHVYTSQRRVNTGRIAVIQHRDITREALDQSYLGLRQGRTATGYHILYSRLVHGDDIHLTFHQVAHIRTCDRLLGLEKTVQLVGLGVDERVRRVDVLAHIVFLLQDTSGESDGFAADGEDREDHAVAETVIEPTVFALANDADTDLGIHVIGNELLFEAFLFQSRSQRIAFLRRVAELVLTDDVVPQSAFVEITESDRLAFGRLP